MAIELVEQHVERCDERFEAMEIFRGGLDLDVPTMTEHFRDASDSAFLFWFAFDFQLRDGSYLVDRILAANPVLSAGERRYLEQMRTTAMMPYEVVAVRPGVSVTLRRVGAQEEIEVLEKSASGMLHRWDMLVVRLNPLGPSGGPEIEMGAMLMSARARDEIVELVQYELDMLPAGSDCVGLFRELTVDFHQIWLGTIVAPQIPPLVTAENDPLMYVEMWFDVHDEVRVRAAFNGESRLEGEGDTWRWFVDGTVFGTMELTGSQLRFVTDSDSRADRGRRLIEGIARNLVTYRDCERTDMEQELTNIFRSGKRPEAPSPDAVDAIPPEIKDQMFQEFMARHNQNWLDDSIPALDEQTPRVAAQSPALQPRLVRLLKDLENQYLAQLSAGEPAFDTTWMWDELGLSDHADAPRVRNPLWLAHESMEVHVPGINQLIRSMAELKQTQGAGLVRPAIPKRDLQVAEPVQQLIRHNRHVMEAPQLLDHLEFYCNYELGRRKTFWVEESLAWMLANTQVDVESQLFRLPFPTYVLVYTDRHTLGVAERALASDRDCPLRGQMLGVLCAYVMESALDGPGVKVGLTFDSLAGKPPHLMTWELRVARNEPLEKSVAEALARENTSRAGLFQPLLEAVINATLYITSAGSKVDQYRLDRSKQPSREVPEACSISDEVYYLPGKITISHMRKLQQVARGPSGRALLHRFMVRGHWRRPSATWKDQSPRWIEPYWRGPSLASIIEREYRLKP
jgi:hypothetical protein